MVLQAITERLGKGREKLNASALPLAFPRTLPSTKHSPRGAADCADGHGCEKLVHRAV